MEPEEMKKRINIIFFSICFIASLLAEAYCILVLDGDLFSVVGIGLVVLITSYLLMDSIQSKLAQSRDNIRSYLDLIYSEESQKWNERYTELLNMHKATYTATKKSSALLSEQFQEVLVRMETLEANNAKSTQKLIDLQRKALEGQKNALNLEINYGKENTKQLMKVLHEEGSRFDHKEELVKILSCLEENKTLIKEYFEKFERSYSNVELFQESRQRTSQDQNNLLNGEETFDESFYETLNTLDQIDMDMPKEDNVLEPSWRLEDLVPDTSEALDRTEGATIDEEYSVGTEVSILPEMAEDQVTPEMDFASIEIESEAMNQFEDTDGPVEEEKEIAATVTPAVMPLYDDPNKALTADEIAALFASFGQ
jgi:hypothetical protein